MRKGVLSLLFLFGFFLAGASAAKAQAVTGWIPYPEKYTGRSMMCWRPDPASPDCYATQSYDEYIMRRGIPPEGFGYNDQRYYDYRDRQDRQRQTDVYDDQYHHRGYRERECPCGRDKDGLYRDPDNEVYQREVERHRKAQIYVVPGGYYHRLPSVGGSYTWERDSVTIVTNDSNNRLQFHINKNGEYYGPYYPY